MAERPARSTRTGVVTRVERLTPTMVRVVFGGDGLAGMSAGEFTDHYVKLLFPRPGVAYPEPFDMAAVRRDMPREAWPVIRTYTVRRWRPDIPEMWIDFVVHGDEGLAGPWAVAAQPGDRIRFLGPGGAYAPDPRADWHLLAGDESALPAIAAALDRMPAGAPARVFLEVAGPAQEQKLETVGDARIVWLHRGDRPVGEPLAAAVRALDFPPGRVHAFVHGEAHLVKDLRAHLRHDRGIATDQMSVSGYWRRGMDEDGWQAGKRAWNEQVEREQESATA
ncbi:siderophore-interacting protein [Mangrovihabitans endophyticus]|uniref:Siderophore-interacting protein n=1 Tax=Mangrovihabitans endophyticus TaxID=1751298 RepID=A0A8J3C7P1_9ACTN|nr:siderophore-interacting protein [Mangrovihabitans endophyticus]GGL19576.1 siderophore-interacting protein [Mangrovihabitans endophyticus]